MPNQSMPRSSTSSDADDLLPTVRQTLADHCMLAAGDRVLVAVSGGADSMVLLYLLTRLASEMKISLGVAHLNHGLRGDAANRDAHTVQAAANRLNLAFHVGRAFVERVRQGLGLSLEEAARRVRYAFFNKIMRDAGYNKLALGHHQDDNAEQILIALLRGTGPGGLCGIVPVRQNRLVRPLIQVRRCQIEAYAKSRGIPWVTDASNHDPRFLRNRIRHRLLPLIASDYNPSITRQLNQLADVMRTEEEWIGDLITPHYANALVTQKKDGLALCTHALRQMHPALVRRLLRRALLDLCGTLRRISFSHIQAVQRLIGDGVNGKTVHLPRGIRVYRDRDWLQMVRVDDYRRPANRDKAKDPPETQAIVSPPFPCKIESVVLGIGMTFYSCSPDRVPRWQEIKSNQAFFDLDRLRLPLILRTKQPGDRFNPLGNPGSQKLKKYFIDHHISRQDRLMTPILADQRQIVWLVGQRIDDRMKITSATTRVLVAEFFLLDIR